LAVVLNLVEGGGPLSGLTDFINIITMD
jgi:hypothetical protein